MGPIDFETPNLPDEGPADDDEAAFERELDEQTHDAGED